MLRREIGDSRGLALSQHCLCLVAFARGDLERALSLQTDSLAGFRRLGFKRYIGWTLLQMAHIDHELGDDEHARGHAVEALQSAVQRGDKQGIADCLDLFADLSVMRGDWQRAAHGWGAADDVREQIGARRALTSSAAHDRQLTRAEAAVGKPTLTLWLAQGRSLSDEEAVALGHETVSIDADVDDAAGWPLSASRKFQ